MKDSEPVSDQWEKLHSRDALDFYDQNGGSPLRPKSRFSDASPIHGVWRVPDKIEKTTNLWGRSEAQWGLSRFLGFWGFQFGVGVCQRGNSGTGSFFKISAGFYRKLSIFRSFYRKQSVGLRHAGVHSTQPGGSHFQCGGGPIP